MESDFQDYHAAMDRYKEIEAFVQVMEHGSLAAAALHAGITPVMITGDHPATARAIAHRLGIVRSSDAPVLTGADLATLDDAALRARVEQVQVYARVDPAQKIRIVEALQAQGHFVAMTGDGTNDAPALAQADVAVAMNTGTQAAKEAGNMVDLDSNPTKLLEVVETGKALLMTRGSLTTFSIANDVAKYFAIIPAIFVSTYPQLAALNVMQLESPQSAILSAVVFNALIIIVLIPLALKGVKYRAVGAAALLRRNLLIYGLGGLAVPFVGIKVIDLMLAATGLF
eukprot:gene38-52_t